MPGSEIGDRNRNSFAATENDGFEDKTSLCVQTAFFRFLTVVYRKIMLPLTNRTSRKGRDYNHSGHLKARRYSRRYCPPKT